MVIAKTLEGFLQNPIRFPPKPFTLSPQTLKGFSRNIKQMSNKEHKSHRNLKQKDKTGTYSNEKLLV